jgi:hypothetical protein
VAYVVGVLLAIVISLARRLLRMRRIALRARREDPEWAAAWKRASRSRRRRIGRALRQGETVYDADDARLLVGLSRRTDRQIHDGL